MVSLPSPTTAAILNPSTVSFDRGLGLETIYQSGNPVVFNLASGTGRLGGALISTSLENSFFGNRVYETLEDFFERSQEKKQYKTKKLNLALGAKLYRKKYFSLDAGVILKRHHEIKRINPGAGVSARLGPLNFGASVYQDDFMIPLTGEDYTERFNVTTYSVGTKFKNFSIDAGVIKSSYKYNDSDTEIHLYSGSYVYRNFMFNLAFRNEMSLAPIFVDEMLEFEKTKSAWYGGVQTSLGRHLILGLNYNYFLLKEVSLMASFYL